MHVCNFIKKEIPTHAFSCEVCDFKNTCLVESLQMAASDYHQIRRYTLFYKQHFYEQRQTEIGKKKRTST